LLIPPLDISAHSVDRKAAVTMAAEELGIPEEEAKKGYSIFPRYNSEACSYHPDVPFSTITR